ncbi:MAG: hypothetical protein QOG99_383 [Frankiales bacterium]|nr:hypothetical protein [Frankiales bacterium]
MRRTLLGLVVVSSIAAGSFANLGQAAAPAAAAPLKEALAKGTTTLVEPRPPSTADRYAPANGCFALRSVASGKLVTRIGTGFAATGTTGEPFRFQAFDLGKYLLFGSHADFLATAADPAPTQEAAKVVKGYLAGTGDEYERAVRGPADTALDTGVSAIEVGTAPLVAQVRGDKVIDAAAPSASAEWVLKQVGSSFVLQQAYDDGDESVAGPLDPAIAATVVSSPAGVLTAGAGALTAKAARFALVATKGCAVWPESGTGVTGPIARGATGYSETKGYVDAHQHTMSFEFLGGRVICGRVWHPYGIDAALQDCPDHKVANGQGALLEDVLSGQNPATGHATDGYPTFSFWPHYDSLTHQQVYYKWLERAWRGGLRMYTNLLVQNGQLCELWPLKKNTCDEMETVALEANRTRELERFIDAQYGGPGRGWYRIVTDPLQARRVINSGRLAVILGIEVSRPLGCRDYYTGPSCTAADIDKRLSEVYKLGVRQMEMTNKFDNALTGVTGDDGTTGVIVNNGNYKETGHFWEMTSCQLPFGPVQHDKQQYNVADESQGEVGRDAIFGAILKMSGATGVAPVYPSGPQCNAIGLSSLGKVFLDGLMKRGMIFDPDHMSAVARQEALDYVAAHHYSGIVSSHSWADDANYFQILKLGGIVTPHAESSSSFLGKWEVLRKHADSRFLFGIGWGSDISGFSAQGAPRNPKPGKGVTYPFRGLGGTTIAKSHTGVRTWDINTEGVEHYGLYPDWVQDVQVQADQLGDGAAFTKDVQNAAEAFLQMWERGIGVRGDACRSDIPDLSPAALAGVKGKTPEQVLAALGQPHARVGAAFTFCTTSGTRVVRFSSAGRAV